MAQEKLIDKVNDTPLRKIAYPLVIENLLFLAFSSIDVFMLSGYSDNAVAAVGLITQYTWFLLLLLQVIPNGATISLTNFLGAGQVEKAKKISRTALQMVIVFGLFFGLVMFFLFGLSFLFFKVNLQSIPFLSHPVIQFPLLVNRLSLYYLIFFQRMICNLQI